MSTGIMGTMDKIRKLRASRPKGGGNGRLKGIFHQWKEGDNEVRLVGPFVETKTHFLAPVPKRGERGLCGSAAFNGDDKIPQVINCLNWDSKLEEEKVGQCPICRLGDLAHQALKEDGIEEKEKKALEKLRRDCRARTQLKWNILDREDPYVLSVSDGNERRVLGYKIATVGMEAWSDIEGIFDQMGFDISDPEEGLDITVNRGHNGTRVSYSAQACIDTSVKPPTAKVTPLTVEEKALTLNDIQVICGKSIEASRIIDALHEDYREFLEVNMEAETVSEPERKKESGTDQKVVEAAAAAVVADDDDDGLMGGTVSTRTSVKN